MSKALDDIKRKAERFDELGRKTAIANCQVRISKWRHELLVDQEELAKLYELQAAWIVVRDMKDADNT